VPPRDVCTLTRVVAVALFFSACGGSSSPVQPTPSAARNTPREFSLSGEVYDIAGRPLGGTRIEVIDGPRAGAATTTDESGRFSMPGTFTGMIRVTASKEGYLSVTKSFSEVVQHVFSLEPLGPPADIAGEYTLRLTADSACTSLPQEARTRSFTAAIVPSGRSRFVANLRDASFFARCAGGPVPASCVDQFSIGMVGDYAGVYVGIIEQLAETTYLLVDGEAQGSFDHAGFTAPLKGSVVYCPSEPVVIDQGTWACVPRSAASCDSANHRLTLVRR
jgi:hypothetical protein